MPVTVWLFLFIIVFGSTILLNELFWWGVFQVFRGYFVSLEWAFRRRTNGTYSVSQVAGQIVILGVPLIICLLLMVWCFADLFRQLFRS